MFSEVVRGVDAMAFEDALVEARHVSGVEVDSDLDQAALKALTSLHGAVTLQDADVLVALGGDGFMLQTLHRHGALGKPVYGMKLGTVGFLMNHGSPGSGPVQALQQRIAQAEPAVLHPLEMLAQTRQAAHVGIELNGQLRLDELICDGVMVATPAGSTAYNFSANGPILPLGANVMALTPIAPFRPRRWRGAVLKSGTEVRFRVLDPHKRPVSATADSHEVRDVTEVLVREQRERSVTLLFDPEHNLEERILAEQFTS